MPKPRAPRRDPLDTKLTDKERLFCQYYVQSLNATSAYMKISTPNSSVTA